MQKIFPIILMATILFLGSYNNIALADSCPNPRPSKMQIKQEFEKRLNLTEKQKEQAKAIHEKGKEQIKPIFEEIQLKKQEIEAVQRSRIAPKMQQEKIAKLENEITELRKQAREIRKQNTKEFEKILNKKQKAELEKMKAEGRARFEQRHPARPPFQGLGTPNFLMLKPLLPPPPPPEF